MKFAVIFLILALLGACVKDEGYVPASNISGGNTNGSGGGGPAPVDPLAQYAWHLKNTGQTSFAGNPGIAGEDISLDGALALGFRGKGVRIAVSDTGVETIHPDLAENLLASEHRNYASSISTYWRGNDPIPSDGNGHGTSVAGLLAAIGWNSIGSRGVAPEAKMAAFRYIMNYPTSTTEESYTARMLDQLDGDFDIFNNSYGSASCSFDSEVDSEQIMLKEGATNLRSGKGALYVQSSGNDFVFDPADCPNTYGNANRDPSLSSPYKIVVGAVNALGVKATYSTPGSNLWASAPGGEDGIIKPAMITTDITGCNYGYSYRQTGSTHFNFGYNSLNLGCNYTTVMNGASSAAPILSGVIALMLEANPDLTWRDVKHILAVTSDMVDYNVFDNYLFHPDAFDLSFPAYIYDNKWTTNKAGYHFSNWYGFGRVNAEKAVTMAKDYDVDLGIFESSINPNTKRYYYESGALNLSIPDYSTTGVSNAISVLHNFIVESVQIKLTLDHPAPGELAIHLVSPKGTESRLVTLNTFLDNTSLDVNFPLTSNAFYGEESYGNWTLKVYDGTHDNSGAVKKWILNVMGHRKSVSGTAPIMPGLISMNNTYGSANSSPPGLYDPSPSPSVIRYEMSVGSTPGVADKSAWESLGLTPSFQAKNLRLVNRRTYYLNIRAIGRDEHASAVRTMPWTVSY